MAQPYSVCHRRYRPARSHRFVKHIVLIIRLNEIMRHPLHHLVQIPAVCGKHQRLHFRMMHEISEAFHVMLNFQRRYSKVSHLICLAMLHRRNTKLIVLLYSSCRVYVYPGTSKISYVFSMVSLSVLVAYQHTTSTSDF